MTPTKTLPLSLLYEQDETAWLETMSQLAAKGRFAEMDQAHLSEYLSDMARRDRREVFSRLVALLAHVLKWNYQANRRSKSWRITILRQRSDLRELLDSGTPCNHALEVLARAYADARKRAVAETELSQATFPPECPWDVDTLLVDDEESAAN